MKRYPAYQEVSGPCFVEIPQGWKLLYLKQLCHEKCDKNVDNQENNVLSLSYGRIIRKKNINSGLSPKDFATYQIVKPDDIILRLTDLQNDHRSLRTGLVREQGAITAAYTCLTGARNVRFLHYVLHALDLNKVFYRMGSGVRQSLSYGDIRYLSLPVPSDKEQQQIVRYLDWQTAQIDKAIRGYERLLALLEERKTAVINEAVTQGIRRDVLLKDSGVNWLDRIPQHWQMRYAKQLFSLRRDRAGENDEQLTSSQKYGIISQKEFMEREGRRVTVVLKGEDILKHVESGDFVISMRSFQGGLEYSTVSGKISSAYVMLIPNHELVYDRYFRWLFKSESYIRALQGTSDLIRDGQALRYANFAKVYLPCIPLNEQKEIADYIDMSVEHIDNAMAPIQRQIDLLRERRTRLIADVVTGQVDVRDIAVPAVAAETEVMTDGDEYDGAGA